MTLREQAGLIPGPRLPPGQKGWDCYSIGGFASPGAGRELAHLFCPLFPEGP